jgi:hypothetical protein
MYRVFSVTCVINFWRTFKFNFYIKYLTCISILSSKFTLKCLLFTSASIYVHDYISWNWQSCRQPLIGQNMLLPLIWKYRTWTPDKTLFVYWPKIDHPIARPQFQSQFFILWQCLTVHYYKIAVKKDLARGPFSLLF